MGLGLKATIPLGFWSFWRVLVRQQSRLKVSEKSRNLEGIGGGPGVQKGFGVGGMGYGVWGMGNGKGKIGNHDAKWWKKRVQNRKTWKKQVKEVSNKSK